MKKLVIAICAAAAGTALFAEDVSGDNVYGVMNVDSDTKTTIVGVPWLKADGSTAVLSDLISKDALLANDQVYLYDESTSKWYSYKLNSNKTWDKYTTVGGSNNEVAPADDATVKELPRGTAMVLVRNDVTKPILLSGKYDSTSKSVTVTKGTSALIANPSAEQKYIGNAVGNVGDLALIFKDGGASVIYTRKSDGWYWDVATQSTHGSGTYMKSTKLENGVPVLAGQGVWYVCANNSDASITW